MTANLNLNPRFSDASNQLLVVVFASCMTPPRLYIILAVHGMLIFSESSSIGKSQNVKHPGHAHT